jgi:hypothetical protein
MKITEIVLIEPNCTKLQYLSIILPLSGCFAIFFTVILGLLLLGL